MSTPHPFAYTDDETEFLEALRRRVNTERPKSLVMARADFDRLEDLLSRVPGYEYDQIPDENLVTGVRLEPNYNKPIKSNMLFTHRDYPGSVAFKCIPVVADAHL